MTSSLVLGDLYHFSRVFYIDHFTLPSNFLLSSLPRQSPIEDAPTSGLILPKKVRGTPTMYADLQFPKSSNSGDLKRRARLENEIDRFLPKHKTEYGRIVFNPAFAERANL